MLKIFQIIFILVSVIIIFISAYIDFIVWSWPYVSLWSSEHYAALTVKFKILNVYAAFINILFIIYALELKDPRNWIDINRPRYAVEVIAPRYMQIGSFLIVIGLPFTLNIIGLTTPFFWILSSISMITEALVTIYAVVFIILAVILYRPKPYGGITRINLFISLLIFINSYFLASYHGVILF